MALEHDPIRQANFLQQCLSHDKRAIGFFLAAGCPLAIQEDAGGKTTPLIPDIRRMTAVVRDCLSASEDKTDFACLMKQLKDDGYDEPNVEIILSHVRAVRRVAGKGKVRGLDAATADKLDAAICDIIVDVVKKSLPNRTTPYHQLAAWIKSAPRTAPVEIFTTNYDLLTEQALEEGRVPYFDGFVGSHRAFFDPHAIDQDTLPSRWARVWKLHGSINWVQDSNGAVSRGGHDGTRRLIHPSHLKYDESRQMPYLAMLDRLRSFLRQPSAVLVTCGYSFGDEHLNACLVEGLRGNPKAMLFALAFGELKNYEQAIKLATMQGNFSLLAGDRAVLGTRTAPWLKRESNPDGVHTTAVEWLAGDAGNPDAPKAANFRLGDFARLGDFLAELIGAESTKADAADEK